MDNGITRQRQFCKGQRMTFGVQRGNSWEVHSDWVKKDSGSGTAWQREPGLEGFSGEGIELRKLGFRQVVDSEVKSEGGKKVSGVDFQFEFWADKG